MAQSVMAIFLVLACSSLFVTSQTTPVDWKQVLQQQVRAPNLEAAQQTAECRISEAPADLEAHGWRGRVLAWRGQWAEAESEYRFVLRQAPNDTEILTGLADVLIWQQRAGEALQVLDQARALRPTQTDILIRRARLLAGAGRTHEARAEFHHVIALEPSNEQAKSGLSGLAELTARTTSGRGHRYVQLH